MKTTLQNVQINVDNLGSGLYYVMGCSIAFSNEVEIEQLDGFMNIRKVSSNTILAQLILYNGTLYNYVCWGGTWRHQ